MSIYQASFGDGGSKLDLTQWDLLGANTNAVPANFARSQQNLAYQFGQRHYKLEVGDFRLFNIEDVDTTMGQQHSMQNAMSVTAERKAQNIGPSIQFKLRDQQGLPKNS